MKFYKIFKFNKNNIPRNDSLIISIIIYEVLVILTLVIVLSYLM